MCVYKIVPRIPKKYIKIILACSAGLVLSSCANKNIPLIEDYADLNSADVVRKVICETKYVIDEYATNDLRPQFEAIRDEMEKFDDENKLNPEVLFTNTILSTLAKLESISDNFTSKLKDTQASLKVIEEKITEIRDDNEVLDKEISSTEELITAEQNAGNKVPAILIKNLNLSKLKMNRNQNILPILNKQIIEKNKMKADLEPQQDGAAKNYQKYLSSHKQIYEFLATSITHVFDFDILETNNATIGLDLTKPISNGSYSDKSKAGPGALMRDSQRTIHITATFEELRLNDCNYNVNNNHVEPRKLYPITGNIGVGHFITRYLDIREYDKVRSKEDTFQNVIIFTTDLKGSVNPKISLVPVVGGMLDLSAALSSGRKDVHKVDLSIIVPSALGAE